MITSTPLTPEQYTDWKAHVLACFPAEACAYLVDDKIFPVPNKSTEPKKFAVSVLDRYEANKGKITGFLHSHAMTSLEAGKARYPVNWPSHADMKGWLADDTRWGISATDGEEMSEPIWLDDAYIAPLEGRIFISGIWDCYSAIRDWFRVEKGITLTNYARYVGWHERGEDLYEENFAGAGFTEVDARDATVGDVVLMSVGARGVINHAGVITAPNLMLHQNYSQSGQALSCNIEIGRWTKHIIKYIRYTKTP